MPKQLEKKLKATAKKKGYRGARADRYVYGTMRKTGWRPSREMDAATHGSPPFSPSELEQGFRRLG